MTPETLAAVQGARQAGRPIVLATRLSDGAQLLLPDGAADAALTAAALEALRKDQAATIVLDGAEWFLAVHAPPYRILILGAVHIAQALAPMARALGYGVTVIDPRRHFLTPERFPDAARLASWPDEAMAALAPDERTAVVALTHDPKLDDPALDQALRGKAFYIGALGSRRTHAARLARLSALGHDEAAAARIRGPVGLAIGAVTASEIALSILAEIVAVRRGAPLAGRG